MIKISAVIISFNEERNIERCLRSLDWADEIVLVDSGSTDRTALIARNYTDRVIMHEWEGFVKQKIYATALASNDWVFSIDADEEVSADLKKEIQRIRQSIPSAAAYRMARKMFYLGRWIKHGSWYPDYKVRLFNRKEGYWIGLEVHEFWRTSGRYENLSGDLLHYSYQNLTDHMQKINILTSQAAAEMQQKGKQAKLWNMLINPWAKFLKSYLIQLGFLDGFVGLVIALMGSYYVLLKYLKLWELRHAHIK